MLTIFYNFFYSKKLVIKVVFGDRVDLLNDFFTIWRMYVKAQTNVQ